MKNQAKSKTEYKPESSKVASVVFLYAISIIIILSGASFIVYSILNNVSLHVLNSNIPGAIFGMVISFLGVRYLLSVGHLKAEVYKNSSKFSWNNFRKQNAQKPYAKSNSKRVAKV